MMEGNENRAEDEVIEFYFFKGFQYNEILLFISKYHNVEMSFRTLKRRLRSLCLKRRSTVVEVQECRRALTNLIDGPGSSRGYCSLWHSLHLQGFPIHGCIDGYSRKILWLYVTKSNNCPSNIAAFYVPAVSEFNGCPVKLITDAGTENGTMAGLHSFCRNDLNSHRYVTSPQNQRIEGWWSFFRRTSAK